MSDALVTLTIEGVQVDVPKGTLIVDAAKRAGIDIPVFCYHPKLKPVGMCRMCLVEVGRAQRDRATGQMLRDEQGRPVVKFAAKLETACTTPVEADSAVRVNSPAAVEGRKQMVEFLLTSHPLDCPVCDKGGECPLQNQTLEHGPGVSRFVYDDKMHLAKRMPLGELIVLDRERCIQCARCIRFQEEVVDDPVIGFFQRGRELEIVTFSDPGFNSYFSGNTTDICPVGALTTVDFRFGARPWELNAAASICPHCPVGCNLTLNTRREAKSDGREVIKRVMPRQNERVNELWICDKGRFGQAFATSRERLTRPLARRNGALVEVSWEEAFRQAAEGLRTAGRRLVGVAGGRASNEDLFNFRRLVEGLGGRAVLHDDMGGGDLVQQVGLGRGTDLGRLGRGDAVLVIASDLHEEAPIWWLRLKQAADRGAALVVANARPTRLERYASRTMRFPAGQAVQTASALLHAVSRSPGLAAYADDAQLLETAQVLMDARNLVVFYGAEGLDRQGCSDLARACASLLASSGHVGRADNGLIAVWPHANTQGAWDLGLRPEAAGTAAALEGATAALVMAADPVGDEPALADTLQRGVFMVVQELFITPTARLADVVLPAQSFVEREGSFTSGERRVQRYYPAVPPLGETRPDWLIAAELGRRLGVEMPGGSAAEVMLTISESVPDYSGVTYQAMAQLEPQWPPAGDGDLYLGGTAYKNKQGLGVQLAPASERGQAFPVSWAAPGKRPAGPGLLLLPVTRLYDRGTTLLPSQTLAQRMAVPRLEMSREDARRMGVQDGAEVEMRWEGGVLRLPAAVTENVPPGMLLLPRSVGLPVQVPTRIELTPVVGQVAP